jgi:glycerophosphoryl diester phosphodiesterase
VAGGKRQPGAILVKHGLAARTWADFRLHWRQPLAFHLLMQLFGVALFTPLVTWIGRRLVLASGEPVISNFDIAKFVLSLDGIAFVLVLVALTVALLLAEFAGHSWIAGHAIARRPTTLPSTIATVLRLLPGLILLAARMFVRLLLLALPFLAVAGIVWFAMLAGHDINYYLAEQPPEWRQATRIVVGLVAGYALLAAWQLARWLYALPMLVFQGTSPGQSLDDSTRATSGRLRRIVVPLVLWWVLLTAVAFAITWACRHVFDAGLDWAGIDFRRVLPLVAVYLVVSMVGGFLYGALWFAGHQFLVTRMYAELAARAAWQPPAELEIAEERSRSLARLALVAIPILLVLASGTAWLMASRLDMDNAVAITAHRGASVAAPENTMAAFRAALDAGATYAELDVQHTRDRRIIVLHDADVLRMGGDPRKVQALTAAELATIDIGRKYAATFAGEHPPTLEEVIDLVRGRMKINIELKYNVPDPGLAPAVVDLLRRKDFLDEVVITSLDYAALKQVEQIEPRLATGHIVTAAVGNVVRTEADFLSLNSARATPSLVRRAHAAGKQVHVWTVNKPEVMLRMIERGVDNIITDDPALLARVIGERKALGRPALLGLRLRVLFDIPPRELTDPAAVEPL